jgi:hypothetical protein
VPFRILAEVETVFVHLRRATGETLEGLPGEVVDIHPDDSDALAEHLALENPLLEHTDDPADPWPRDTTPPDDPADHAAAAELAAAARDEQAAADRQAHAQELLEAEAALRDAASADAADNEDPPHNPSATADAPTA